MPNKDIESNISSCRVWSDEEKLKLYIRIIRLLLEEEDSVQAEAYYKRAALYINSTQDRELQLTFKLCQARMSDFGRRFLESAMRYHELSCATTELDEEECGRALYVFFIHKHFMSPPNSMPTLERQQSPVQSLPQQVQIAHAC